MTLVAAPSDLQAAMNRIESWLLHSGIQITDGAQRGGIAGWLDRDGRPEFVDLEIAGYYLTAMAWLASGAADSSGHVQAANLCAGRVADWVATFASRNCPSARRHLFAKRVDRCDEAAFLDLAMAARGVAATLHPGDRRERRQAPAALCAIISRISSDADVRPGPHDLKAAAAILGLPKRVAGGALVSEARETCEYWMHALCTCAWPCAELHDLLYGLEGMLILAGKRDAQGLGLIERPFARLMEETQRSDGTLSETVHGGTVRSDVLAQALRVGLLLRGRGLLTDTAWRDRLDMLAEALLGFVRPDGAVVFSREKAIANTRCALFALQALDLSARKDTPEPAPTTAFQLLV